MSGPTRLEAGRGHVLAYCEACAPWRRITNDRPEAMREAADHLELVHGARRAATQLRAEAARMERRHADTPPNAG